LLKIKPLPEETDPEALVPLMCPWVSTDVNEFLGFGSETEVALLNNLKPPETEIIFFQK